MKVIALVGSARKNGATAEAVKDMLAAVGAKEAETDTVFLKDRNINFCVGCNFCRTHEGCSQKDDMEALLNEMYEADAVVIGTPIFFGQMSGILKTFADRLYPAYRGGGVSKLKGKKLYLVYTQHSDPEKYAEIRAADAAYLYNFLGFDIVRTTVNGVEV